MIFPYVKNYGSVLAGNKMIVIITIIIGTEMSMRDWVQMINCSRVSNCSRSCNNRVRLVKFF